MKKLWNNTCGLIMMATILIGLMVLGLLIGAYWYWLGFIAFIIIAWED